MRRALAILATLMVVLPAQASEVQPGLAEQALSSLDKTSLDGWAFTETTVRNGTETVARYDPSRPDGERWSLHSIEGRAPTDKERREFERRRAGGGKKEEEQEDSEEQGLSAVIEADSLIPVRESETHAVYSFRPASGNEEGEDGMSEYLDGTLRISKAGPYVESLEMRSSEPFSPAFGVKIKEFSTVMTFAPVGDEGMVLPESVAVRMVGRAMLFKKLDETVKTRFSEYRFVGQAE